MTRIGVLAIQGDVAEHERTLRMAGAEPVRVLRAWDLQGLDGLVLPGGESTTIGLLAQDTKLLDDLRLHVRSGRPTWGTCAGVILLADTVLGHETVVGGMDIQVERNGFGRQVESFEADVDVPAIGPPPFRAVFIRAPLVRAVGPGVEELATLDGGVPVALRSGRILATVFHPELTDDLRLVRLFLASA